MAEKELLGVWEFTRPLSELSDEEIDALAEQMYDSMAATLADRKHDDD